ncbi:carcinine hydrolase/isopenicillin-N N-acyltransferase family protein (plasmid) [Arsenophonus sp. aPb]|uniref:carcinine hydrolase/isopenicillin-N N-acyltransferase family protein n=1 Tax=Arsenophonus sp. aPb TaxID=3041619 RepID=UPI0024694DEE|nr:carcinine hydrolase/isopenicillin-N N-acyltransferase family protein [Arsenophonus sp. aPb]WGL99852.1 carcinine hydrolase/isopenicillin-N N-acyltransferase family protein [Arsenophonus sp. aPb]
MGKNIATVTNTVDNFNNPSLEKGAPNSGISMSLVIKHKTVNDIIKALENIKINSAYSPSFVDKYGKIITIEIQDSGNKVIDGTSKGYVVHTNHPIGKESELVGKYANGNYHIFDNIAANTIWRYQQAELHAKFSPLKNIDAIKEILTQKPILMEPREGNDFVSVNSVIHDLHAGCSYGTTWISNIQNYTKVCFK